MIGGEYRAWLLNALDGTRDYLVGRQCGNGGFSFYRSDFLEEPDPSSTWHAIGALARLGADIPRSGDVARYVIGQSIVAQPYGLYFRTRVLDRLGLDDPHVEAVKAAVATLPVAVPSAMESGTCARLERLRLTLWLKRRLDLRFHAGPVADALSRLEGDGGGFGTPPNLIDTRQALSCLALCDRPTSERCARFVENMAVPDFGFRLAEHSLSPTLEVVCAGLACSRRIGRPAAYPIDALVSILECQTGNGGFARAPGALPDIRFTHLALIGLETLAGALPGLKEEQS